MANAQHIARIIDQALGRTPADLVIRNTRFLEVISGKLFHGDIAICGDRIVGTQESYHGVKEIDGSDLTVVPGFIDTHVHCESSLVTPLEFDRCVLPRGTTTAICDPHEIANVLGSEGIQYFMRCAEQSCLDLRVQLSSCVPTTELETAGARLSAADLVALRDHPSVIGLAEFMNYPGLLAKDPQVLDKLAAFQGWHIDGHAPLVRGKNLNAYLACGICTCHETTSAEEAREKLSKGMHVLIREGTVSKDLAALAPLLDARTSNAMAFCTDDRNPLDIAEQGHLDYLIRRAIALGIAEGDAYRAATWSAARAFGLRDRGLVAPGKRADLVLLSDYRCCEVHSVVSAGRLVSPELFAQRQTIDPVGLNSVKRAIVRPRDFLMPATTGDSTIAVIGVNAGSIVTDHRRLPPQIRDGYYQADTRRDILKVCVLERHGHSGDIGRGFVQGFGLLRGALASSVGHDSHNLCVLGSQDDDMAVAVNRLIDIGGGFAIALDGQIIEELPLPVAGLMSLAPYETVHQQLAALRDAVQALGCSLPEPFLQLAFLALPVIPHLKITDQGLVDVDNFCLLNTG
ncbi:adenine deaminase [Zhongshania sp.]|uniref:adenine deaminase n=1 Tax=Zhongshania sp. TaxID=1971902 RepID=UPI003562041A